MKEVNPPSLYCKMTKHITLIWTTFSGYFNNFIGTCRRMTTVKARAQLRIKISFSFSYSSQNLKVAFVRVSDRSVFPAVAEEYQVKQKVKSMGWYIRRKADLYITTCVNLFKVMFKYKKPFATTIFKSNNVGTMLKQIETISLNL